MVLPHSYLSSLPSEGEVVKIVLKDAKGVQEAASSQRQGNFWWKFEEAINLGGSYYQVWKRAESGRRERRQIGLECKSTKISHESKVLTLSFFLF